MLKYSLNAYGEMNILNYTIEICNIKTGLKVVLYISRTFLVTTIWTFVEYVTLKLVLHKQLKKFNSNICTFIRRPLLDSKSFIYRTN